MSTKLRKGKRANRYARMIVLNEPLRRRDQPAAPLGPSPACLGGSHRRCLLDASTCSCSHHRTEYLYPVPSVAREVFVCPVCGVEFDAPWLRVEHVRVSHPVVTTIHDDDWRADAPKPPAVTPRPSHRKPAPSEADVLTVARRLIASTGVLRTRDVAEALDFPCGTVAIVLSRLRRDGELPARHVMGSCRLERCPICYGDKDAS